MLSNQSSFKTLIKLTQQKKQNVQQNQQSPRPNPLSKPKICIISDEYSKDKLFELQQQISRIRKEMVQKQSYHNKEKGNLLSKIQILSAQNIEIKQRQANLIKLNETLQLAMSTATKRQNSTFITKQIQQLRNQLNEKNTIIRQLKRNSQQYKKIVKNLQAEKYRLIDEKEKIVYEVNNKYKTMSREKQQMLFAIRNDILSLPFKKQMINMILQSIAFLQNKQQNTEYDNFIESEGESHYIQSPISKRKNAAQIKGFKQSKMMDQSYSHLSHLSANSIINQLYRRQTESQFSQDNQDCQKLLCQVCKKVFSEQQFIKHMDQCNQVSQLNKKRNRLQKAIDQLNMQQRKSVSQKKNNLTHRCHVLQQWDSNTNRDNSKSKFTAKNMIYADNTSTRMMHRNTANRAEVFTNYKSNKMY